MQNKQEQPQDEASMLERAKESLSQATDSIKQVPDKVQENIPESFKHPKESLMSSLQGAKDTIHESLVGSKSIPTELTKLKDTYIDFYKKSISSNLKAVGKLVTLHPIQAVKEFVGGTTGNLRNMTNIITSPSRFAVAGGTKVAGIGKSVAELPAKAVKGIAKSPLRVWDALNSGTNRLFGLAGKVKSWNEKG